MKLFRNGSIDIVQECHFGIELPICLRQDRFLSRYNCVEIYFVDIVVSCDCDAVVQRNDFLLFNFICLPLLIVNKVDHII